MTIGIDKEILTPGSADPKATDTCHHSSSGIEQACYAAYDKNLAGIKLQSAVVTDIDVLPATTLIAFNDPPRGMTANQRWEWEHMTPSQRWDYGHMSRDEQWTRGHMNQNEKWDYDHMSPAQRWDHDHPR